MIKISRLFSRFQTIFLLMVLLISGVAGYGSGGVVIQQSRQNAMHLAWVWTAEKGVILQDTLAISPDGIIYVVDSDKMLHAVDNSGRELWQLPAMKPSQEGTFHYFSQANLYIDHWGHLFFGPGDTRPTKPCPEISYFFLVKPLYDAKGNIYAQLGDKIINLYPNCTERWQVNTDIPYPPLLISSQESRIYIGTTNGGLEAVDTQNGSLLWSTGQALGLGRPEQLVEGPNGILFESTSQGYLRSFDAHGTITWTDQFDEAGNAAVLSTNVLGELFAIQNGKLYKFTSINPWQVAQRDTPSLSTRQQIEQEIIPLLLGQTKEWSKITKHDPAVIYLMDTENPQKNRTWICKDNQISEITNESDKENAKKILYVYTIQIQRVGRNLRSTQVELGILFDRTGFGMLYTLEKKANGEWVITDSRESFIT